MCASGGCVASHRHGSGDTDDEKLMVFLGLESTLLKATANETANTERQALYDIA